MRRTGRAGYYRAVQGERVRVVRRAKRAGSGGKEKQAHHAQHAVQLVGHPLDGGAVPPVAVALLPRLPYGRSTGGGKKLKQSLRSSDGRAEDHSLLRPARLKLVRDVYRVCSVGRQREDFVDSITNPDTSLASENRVPLQICLQNPTGKRRRGALEFFRLYLTPSAPSRAARVRPFDMPNAVVVDPPLVPSLHAVGP
eukprot:1194263-Prorocentrum_minimum.AAC.3